MRSRKNARPRKKGKRRKATYLDSMSPPNLNHPLEPNRFQPYPAATLQRRCDKHGIIGAFVDPMHGETHWSAWKEHPPTWMDPVAFLKLCEADEGACRLRRRYLKSPTKANLRLLEAHLTKIFDEQQLLAIVNNFDHVASILAEYFAASEAYWKKLPPAWTTEEEG